MADDRGLFMSSCEVYLNSLICVVYSFLISHIPEIQAFILFCASFVYVYYKIKVAKYEAKIKEREAKNGK